MDSIIRQLQTEALDSKIGISDLLRKAKVVAFKLDLQDFLTWIERELNGYTAESQDELPPYRIIAGVIKGWNPYHGWQPVIFEDVEVQRMFNKRGANQPIGELDDIIRSPGNGPIMMDFNPEARNSLMKGMEMQTDIKFHIGSNAIAGVLDAVRNMVLDWSLKLEKEGILGEGLTFSEIEQRKAHDSGATYRIDRIDHFAGIIGGAGNHNNITQINSASQKELQELIQQIKKYAPDIELEKDQRIKLNANLDELDVEIVSERMEPGRVKSLLSSVKNIFVGAAGNVVAYGIIAGIEKFVN